MQGAWSHLVWIVLMTLVMGWVGRSRRAARLSDRSKVLVSSTAVLVIGVVCTGVFLLFAVVAGRLAKPAEWWVPLIFVGFALLGLPVIVEGARVRHELRDDGIAYRGLFFRHDVLWTEIASAHWSPSLKWLVLTTNDGRKLRFSGLLNGLDTLALALHERAPIVRADEATAKVLAEARAGNLPSIWQ